MDSHHDLTSSMPMIDITTPKKDQSANKSKLKMNRTVSHSIASPREDLEKMEEL